MPDPSTLGPEFDHLVDVLELVAQSAGGYVTYDTEIRGRRTGDISRVDAAMYLPGPSDREDLYLIECVDSPRAAGVGVIDEARAKADNIGAARVLCVSSSGFSRPARKRADAARVDLVTLDAPESIEWPGWISNRAFVTGDLDWRVTGVTIPPAPGVPGNAFRPELGRNDALFENPTGRKFTPDQLFRRWLKIQGNEDSLMEEGERAGGETRKKTVLLRFDRPMKLLGTTVRRLPALKAANFEIEYSVSRRVIPVSLMVAPDEEDPWDAGVALVSGAVNEKGVLQRVFMTLDFDEETGERRVNIEAVDQRPQRAEAPPDDGADESDAEDSPSEGEAAEATDEAEDGDEPVAEAE